MCLTNDHYIQDTSDPIAVQVMSDMCAPFTDEFYANGKYTWTFEITHDKLYILQTRHWFSRYRVYVGIQAFLTFLCRNYGSRFVIKYKKMRNLINISFYSRRIQNGPFRSRMTSSPSHRRHSHKNTVVPVIEPVSSQNGLHRNQSSVFANPNDAREDCRINCPITGTDEQPEETTSPTVTTRSWASMVRGDPIP